VIVGCQQLRAAVIKSADRRKRLPTASVDGFGLTEIEMRLAGTTVSVVVSLKLPTVAVSVVWPAPAVDARPEASIVAVDSSCRRRGRAPGDAAREIVDSTGSMRRSANFTCKNFRANPEIFRSEAKPLRNPCQPCQESPARLSTSFICR
jgi:hypothetical protein